MGTVKLNFGHRFPRCVHNWIHKSQNAPVPYPTMLHPEQKCAHFCSEWSIVGYGIGLFWDLRNWSDVCYVCKPGEQVLNNSLKYTLRHWYELILKTIVPEVSPATNPWRRYQVETFSALLVLCTGNSPVTREFPSQMPVSRSFDVFFDLRMNKQLSKQSRRRWFDTPSRWLWRHCNVDEDSLTSTVESPYNTINFNTILHTAQQFLLFVDGATTK